MTADLSIIHLVTNASFLVQLVLLLLVLASVVSWTLIFRKGRQLKDAWSAMESFENRFWSGGDLAELYQSVADQERPGRGGESIFRAGFRNYLKLRQQAGLSPGEVLDGTRRVMRVELNREADILENHLPFLATVGSISPFIGLFGTVWGIMNSFRALGNVSQATLAMVAPGIAEALIATAMGLFAAIPAVIAYNRYITEVERLVNRYDNFLEEFSAILQRQSREA
ncbi:MAG TPA: protein TolQ [Gammaproteobacteria bacterium]|nr:protein TolQ [Gammaproteobacteria bacterium]